MFAIGDKEWPGISKLAEEIGEVGQIIGKLMGTGGKIEHWDGEGNLDARLIAEMADVYAAITFVMRNNFKDEVDRSRFNDRAEAKIKLFEGWHAKGRAVLDGELVAHANPNDGRCATCDRPRSAWCHQPGAGKFERCDFIAGGAR